MKNKKVVVFGNQQITIDCINLLKQNQSVDLLAVIGCEKPRDKDFGYPSLKQYCEKEKILFFHPNKLDVAFLKLLKDLKPDICFSIYYRKIFPASYIQVPPMGFINIHSGVLPQYRGSIPTFWALYNNEKEVGITLHFIDGGIDTGDIIAQSRYKIPKNITGFKLHNKIMKLGVQLLSSNLPDILEGSNLRIKQKHSDSTYFGRFNDTLRLIDWSLPVEQIESKIRALTRPYIGAKSFIFDKEVIFWKVRIMHLRGRKLLSPGKIEAVRHNGQFIVEGTNGFLLVTDFEIVDASKIRYTDLIQKGNEFKLCQ